MSRLDYRYFLFVLFLLTSACSESSNNDVADDFEETGSDGSGDSNADVDFDVIADSDTLTTGLEAPPCNGIDDDGNGIIDDIDVGGDGICDCLNIATVGIPGPWGEGNIFTDWLGSRSSVAVVNLGDAVLDDSILAPFQVIVFLNVGEASDGIGRQYTDTETDALQRWIASGGGIMTTIGYASYPEEVDNINRVLSPYSVGYDPTPVLQKQGNQTVPIVTWQTHAITEGVTAVGVDNGYEVIGDGTYIAEEQNISMAEVTGSGEGNIFVWGDEWICYNSEWQNLGDYQVERFWLNIIKWLTPEDECQVSIPPIL